MSDVIAELLKVADEQDSIELKIFKNAVIKTLQEYQESPTRANKNNMDAARDNLKQKKEEMVTKYLTPPGDGGQAPSFESLLSVCAHLTKNGFKISKSKLYRDRDKGAIRINPDGTVLETEVRAYAATLERINGDVADLSDGHAVKTQREIERLEEQIAKMRFEREKEEGKFIPRKEFEAELAARAVVMEAGFRHTFNVKVREWIAMVGGKAAKSADFLQELNTALDEQLNNFATTRTFQVMFEEEE
ncbi:MAG: hypothetical protein JEZ12_24790 [Desulfobacterium sp.]|nr:hypothetical protein [Desulfobacterium sp.]